MAACQTPSVAAAEPRWPDDAVEVGRIVDAWGVKGWIKVEAWSHDPQALLASKHWFLQPPGAPGAKTLPPLLHVTQARVHAGHVVAAYVDAVDLTGRRVRVDWALDY